jgi:hypothetical protein
MVREVELDVEGARGALARSQGGQARKLVAWLAGEAASHPRAEAYAAEACALLHVYATEIVAQHRLCPFLHNVDNGLGAVCVVLDRDPDVDEAFRAVQASGASVLHVVFPLLARGESTGATGPSSSSRFERFGNALAEKIRRAHSEPLVHATFHPELVGGTENPHRMVGLLRRAPDPFVQFIPPGMHEGGTVIAGAELPGKSPLESTFERIVVGGQLAGLEARLAELHRARDERDARFVDLVSSG